MAGENVKIRLAQGGDTLTVASGGSIVAELGSEIVVQAGASLNIEGDMLVNGKKTPTDATLVFGAGTTNQTLCTVRALDNDGNAIDQSIVMDVWLSDSAAGLGLTTVTASGAVAAGAQGAIIGTGTTKKAFRVVTNTTGVFILASTDTAKSQGIYAACGLPNGNVAVSALSTLTANYG